MCNFNDALLRNIQCLVDVEAVQIYNVNRVVVFVDVVEDAPGDVPFDADFHLLVLFLTDSLLRSQPLTLHEKLLRLRQSTVPFHIVLH